MSARSILSRELVDAAHDGIALLAGTERSAAP